MEYINKILKRVDKLRPEIINFTKRLVEIPTINPPGLNYEKIVSLMEDKLKIIGLKIKKIHIAKSDLSKLAPQSKGLPRINLIGNWNTYSQKTLHMNGHYDVVPSTSGWTKKPFIPNIENEKFYGRGVGDMKAGISMMIYSIQVLKELNFVPKCNISLSITPDEETGSKAGVDYLVRNGFIQADSAIVCEPTKKRVIHHAHNGTLWLEVSVLGKSAHASRPHQGVNSFENMVSLVSKLEKKRDQLKNIKSKHKSSITGKFIYPTMVMGGISSGGTKVNVIPDRTSFSIDRRILPDEDFNKVKDDLIKFIKKSGVKTEIKILQEAHSSMTSVDSEIAQLISKSCKDITGKEISFRTTPGTMDMRFFVNQAKIPCVGFGPEGHNYHGDDEYILIEDLIEKTKILANTILNFR